ncbi:hypothetical protein B0H15DRAFT_949122 [Mycena belliarum]|uniref:Uncharacterized protein n=1 Tax=Mycena belliarum TaxID=1033014 RepID=A0AAD6U9R6_9AGAR|nr:hypothetical protein B0H15DRAFT_949122 [Mycena belliae]
MAQISPYNDSMRLGMGFNSFTQRLCNYAVRPVGAGFEAHPDPPQYKTSAVPHSGNISNGYEVMWTAKFVNTMSEVAQSLNISGAPQIRCDFAPPGGAKTSASFNDTNTFAESDINYLIQVRVSHQRFNHTEFEFIPNLHQSEFTRLYGDSFISGFVEGGEFNALISVKLRDRSDADQVKQQLEAGIGFTATARDLDQSQSAPIDGEITIAVSWKCGGDILDGGMTEWTLNSLKAIVMEFPRKATTCPMRINALLTKYTSLKGFREKDIQGALNYENTGLYTAALLDAYLDYKCICRSIQQISRKVEQGEFALVAKEEMVELAELFTEAKEMPNGLSPYKGSIYGLVKARKDCRIEMLKIIREVDTVEEQPQVACDLTRPQQYLDPAMFRMLLPTTQDLKKARAAAAQEQLSCADLTRKLEISERERTAAEISALGLANELK